MPIDPASGLDPRKKKIVIAGAGVLAVGGYVYYRRRAAAAAAAAAAPADGSSTADTAALGLSSATGPGVYGAQGSAASSTTVGNAPTTNQDWYAAALSAAEDAGYDAGTAAAALAAYLGHQPLTAAQQTVVRIGLGAAGNPPSGTFTIITAPATSGPGQPAPAPAPAPAPGPVPDVAPKTPANLRLLAVTPYMASFGWNTSVGGAYQYKLYNGSALVDTVFGTFSGVHGLAPGHRYGPFTVRAVSHGGHESGPSNPLYVTTKSK
jgi:hypothetical protein